MSRGWFVIGIAGGAILSARGVAAFPERFEDLSASVEVAGVFGLDLSRSPLTFSDVSPGQTAVLGEGHFFNQITCRSNSGRPWYLKAHVQSLTHLERRDALPASSLKWKLVESTGEGQPSSGGGFQEFSSDPLLLYMSRGDDERGREVVLRFQYSLSAPVDALAGTYVGQIVFTMAENP